MYDHSVIIMINSWFNKVNTVQIFRTNMWLPMLNKGMNIFVDELEFDMEIVKYTYVPSGKKFMMDLGTYMNIDGPFNPEELKKQFAKWEQLF